MTKVRMTKKNGLFGSDYQPDPSWSTLPTKLLAGHLIPRVHVYSRNGYCRNEDVNISATELQAGLEDKSGCTEKIYRSCALQTSVETHRI